MRRVLQVALPVPLRRWFDYAPPPNWVCAKLEALQPGVRLKVPFGKRALTGILIGQGETTLAPDRIRSVESILDSTPLIDADLLALARWAADYYHHPIGEVMSALLPTDLRRGGVPKGLTEVAYALTDAGRAVDLDALRRAPRQLDLLQRLTHAGRPLRAGELTASALRGWRPAMSALLAKGLVSEIRVDASVAATEGGVQPAPVLNAQQRAAVDAIAPQLTAFGAYVLHGVTGSGKTEVYIRLIARRLADDKQVMMLVPEIGLTPQLVSRLRQRLGVEVSVLHSGMTDAQRLAAWSKAHAGVAPVIVGTRSAVFTPMPRLGLIIIDEEHDTAFKQYDGFRYHARDVALKRAQLLGVPVVLGSATPSLETMENVVRGRYRRLRLSERAGDAKLPRVKVVDTRKSPVVEGVSRALFDAVQDRLDKGEQSLIFINRRGFAPVLVCGQCGWQAICSRCDASMCLHAPPRGLLCHHCGISRLPPEQCEACHGDLHVVGDGTQRIEAHLAKSFPDARLLRLDRDNMTTRHKLETALARIRDRGTDIVIGTQMVAKGHDFPGLTLVGVVNVDQGLFSHDFRATEHMLQQIMQVTGRAGRADIKGDVLLQTAYPDHRCLAWLRHHDYDGFVDAALQERRQAGYPPFTYLALLRAQSHLQKRAIAFLDTMRSQGLRLLRTMPRSDVRLMDPVPSPMEKRAGRYRAQLLIASDTRRALHGFLRHWLAPLDAQPPVRQVRWSLDVDPIDLY